MPRFELKCILERSATIVEGYLDDPETTRKHFHDGRLLTGDPGRLLRLHRLQLMGRSDDVLKQGGLKYYPYHIEERMRLINGVVDVAVTSPTSYYEIDDRCVAFVPREGADYHIYGHGF